jgi:enterochelin esterase-like enzyme
MNLVLLGSITRAEIVASTRVMRHRQIPVIQQMSAVRNRAAWGSTSTLAVGLRVSESLLEQYPVLAVLDGQHWFPAKAAPKSHLPTSRRVPAQPDD